MNLRLKLYTIFLFILVLPGFFHSTVAQTSYVNLELMDQERNETDADIDIDLKYFWVGHNDTSLFFLFRFANLSVDDVAKTNITLRTSSDDLFLISATMNGSSYQLYIAETSSLTGDSIMSEGGSIMTQYISQRIFVNPALHEFGFFIDWDDINSDVSPVDIVAWSDRPVNPGYDRIPNNGYLTYNANITDIDRTISYQNAIAGNYETDDPLATTTSPDPSTPETSISETVYTTTSTENNFGIATILIFLSFIGLLAYLFYSWYASGSASTEKYGKKDRKYDTSTQTKEYQPTVPIEENNVTMKHIPELDMEVRTCCYQTARLDETYCYCGRAVPKELRDLLNRPNEK